MGDCGSALLPDPVAVWLPSLSRSPTVPRVSVASCRHVINHNMQGSTRHVSPHSWPSTKSTQAKGSQSRPQQSLPQQPLRTIIPFLKVQLRIGVVELHIVPRPHRGHRLVPPLVPLEVVPRDVAQAQHVDAGTGRGDRARGGAVLVDEALQGWLRGELWQGEGGLPKRVRRHFLDKMRDVTYTPRGGACVC